MGKLVEFDIRLTGNKSLYSPGETVTGTVNISAGQPVQYKTIKVNCLGFCGVSSRENSATWDHQEQYFNSTLSVADKGTITQGEHNFPFQFLIPEASPTSFDGTFGRIIYKVRAVIERPRFSKDYQTEKPFYMLNHLDLNEMPDIEKTNSSLTTKKFNYLLVKTGTIELKTKSDLRGYIPGQVIKLTAEIHNNSGKDTGCVLGSLIQKVTYKTKRPFCSTRTIAKVEGAGVKAGKRAEWKEQIIVPSLPPSGIADCSLIVIDYFIEVSLKFPVVLVTLPIYIGNIAVNSPPITPTRPAPPTPGPRLSPHPVAQPRTGCHCVTPSAPPASDLAAPALAKTRSSQNHSQCHPPDCQPMVSPSTIRHTPNQDHSQRQPSCGPSSPVFAEASALFSEGNSTPEPINMALILPLENRMGVYPQGPPPTYEESCSNDDFRFVAGRRPAVTLQDRISS